MENIHKIWKDIKGYEKSYQISNLGKVKSLARIIYKTNGQKQHRNERILKILFDKDGYKFVVLFKNNTRKHSSIHRLIANHFIPNPKNLPEVNHKNGYKQNNRLSNLEWCTVKDNSLHAHRIGLHPNIKGERNPMALLTIKKVKNIKKQLLNYKYGMITKLSKKYNVSPGAIQSIKSNKSWKFI